MQGIISASTILAGIFALINRDKKMISQHINLGILGMLFSVILYIPLVSKAFLAQLMVHPLMPLFYLGIACFFMFLSFGYYVVFFRSFYQTQVKKDYLGRFSSLFMLLVSASRMIGIYIYGLLFENNSLLYPILLLALGMILKLIVHIPFFRIEEKRPLANE